MSGIQIQPLALGAELEQKTYQLTQQENEGQCQAGTAPQFTRLLKGEMLRTISS